MELSRGVVNNPEEDGVETFVYSIEESEAEETYHRQKGWILRPSQLASLPSVDDRRIGKENVWVSQSLATLHSILLHELGMSLKHTGLFPTDKEIDYGMSIYEFLKQSLPLALFEWMNTIPSVIVDVDSLWPGGHPVDENTGCPIRPNKAHPDIVSAKDPDDQKLIQQTLSEIYEVLTQHTLGTEVILIIEKASLDVQLRFQTKIRIKGEDLIDDFASVTVSKFQAERVIEKMQAAGWSSRVRWQFTSKLGKVIITHESKDPGTVTWLEAAYKSWQQPKG